MKLWTVRGTPAHEDAITAFLYMYGYFALDVGLVELLNVEEQTPEAWCWRVRPAPYVGEA